MATACRIGGITAGVSRPGIEALTAYGQRVGMVFQIVDDVLDVVATDEQLGKPAGNDLVEGVYTLPVIRALAAERDQSLRRILGGPVDADAVEQARTLVRNDGAVSSAIDVARRYAAQADIELDRLVATLGGGVDAERVAMALGALADHLIAGVPAFAA
jgi:geranylgeranyl pyrophosphate synthase